METELCSSEKHVFVVGSLKDTQQVWNSRTLSYDTLQAICICGKARLFSYDDDVDDSRN